MKTIIALVAILLVATSAYAGITCYTDYSGNTHCKDDGSSRRY